ncbi:MAG: hypothetical protein COY47_03415 [Chloroflexi bacterium CG_4_10_14_0_8_um_filter_57_5]|nr:MAG: hypothetical protein COY47_03415 [Chloroflexi bacterium CG_4_10_14_0_8_um_filter_57_5]
MARYYDDFVLFVYFIFASDEKYFFLFSKCDVVKIKLNDFESFEICSLKVIMIEILKVSLTKQQCNKDVLPNPTF